MERWLNNNCQYNISAMGMASKHGPIHVDNSKTSKDLIKLIYFMQCLQYVQLFIEKRDSRFQ